MTRCVSEILGAGELDTSTVPIAAVGMSLGTSQDITTQLNVVKTMRGTCVTMNLTNCVARRSLDKGILGNQCIHHSSAQPTS